MSSKKMNTTKGGKIYRCNHCDARCNDDYTMKCYKVSDVYLGRIDETKQTITYYCTTSCQKYMYISRQIPKLKRLLDDLRDSYDKFAYEYKCDLKNQDQFKDEDEFKKSTNLWKDVLYATKNTIRFVKAIIDGTSAYELHHLKFKMIHAIAPYLETFSDNIEMMDMILAEHKYLDTLQIELFAK
jgi:hypothetical protein